MIVALRRRCRDRRVTAVDSGRRRGAPGPMTTGRAARDLVVGRDHAGLAELRLCADGALIEREATGVSSLALRVADLRMQRGRLVVKVAGRGAAVDTAAQANLVELAIERVDRGRVGWRSNQAKRVPIRRSHRAETRWK